MMTNIEPQLLLAEVGEAGEYLNISKETTYRLIKLGKLKHLSRNRLMKRQTYYLGTQINLGTEFKITNDDIIDAHTWVTLTTEKRRELFLELSEIFWYTTEIAENEILTSEIDHDLWDFVYNNRFDATMARIAVALGYRAFAQDSDIVGTEYLLMGPTDFKLDETNYYCKQCNEISVSELDMICSYCLDKEEQGHNFE